MGDVLLEKIHLAAKQTNKSLVTGKKIVATAESIDPNRLILLGASTGGTEAIRVVLESLPAKIPPILIVQHIPEAFSKAFADRLASLTPFEVKEAVNGDIVKSNRVLIAPGGKQMGLDFINGQFMVKITDDPPMNRHKPSVDYLFESVALVRPRGVVAALLTGMGADGAKQLKALKDKGAHTIAQDQNSCIVYGMPKAAVEIGGAIDVLPLDRIAETLVKNFSAFQKVS
jgi:two-component system, chemotaxis family, protein-glutamate methylesterase/glutaminase